MNKQEVLNYLDTKEINYDLINHDPVYTIEESKALKLENAECIVKNIFIRDNKKRHYYLVILPNDKRLDLYDLRHKLESRPLTFVSENDLAIILQLEKGAVTPLGILNDTENKVIVIFDNDLKKLNCIGIHPNQNDATVFMQLNDLERIIIEHGNKIEYLDI